MYANSLTPSLQMMGQTWCLTTNKKKWHKGYCDIHDSLKERTQLLPGVRVLSWGTIKTQPPCCEGAQAIKNYTFNLNKILKYLFIR